MPPKKEIDRASEEVADDDSTIPSPKSSLISNECQQWSMTSSSHWNESLDKGCLPHGLNFKARLYSHARAFASGKLPTVLTETSNSSSHEEGLFKTKTGKIKERNSGDPVVEHDCDIIADLAAREFKSPVIIVEDSAPPGAGQEARVVAFTLDDFFDLLSSTDWRRGVMLRVIGGGLLPLLIQCLIKLEKTGRIRGHSVHTYMNNEFWQNDQEHGVSGAMDDPKLQWHAEKLKVHRVYFSSVEQSNNLGNSQSGVKLALTGRQVPEPALAQRLYKLSKLRVEDLNIIDPQVRIQTLEKEMENCKRQLQRAQKESQAKPTQKDAKGGKQDKGEMPNDVDGKGKKSKVAGEEDIEEIADDPFLFHDSRSKLTEILGTDQATLKEDTVKQTSLETEEEKKEIVVSKASSSTKGSNASVPESVIGEKERDSKNEMKAVPTEGTIAGEKTSVAVSEVKMTSQGTINESSEVSIEEDTEESQKLCLSDDKLYVTGLYLPRTRNRQSAESMLIEANRKRRKERRQRAQNAMEKIQNNLPFDLSTRFKSLAVANEKAWWRTQASKFVNARKQQSGIKATVKFKNDQKPAGVQHEKVWNAYYAEQEHMEIRVAIHNELQENVLSRVTDPLSQINTIDQAQGNTRTNGKHGKEKKQATKPNGDKNKSAKNTFLDQSGSNYIDGNTSSRKVGVNFSHEPIRRRISILSDNRIPTGKSEMTKENLMIAELQKSSDSPIAIPTNGNNVSILKSRKNYEAVVNKKREMGTQHNGNIRNNDDRPVCYNKMRVYFSDSADIIKCMKKESNLLQCDTPGNSKRRLSVTADQQRPVLSDKGFSCIRSNSIRSNSALKLRNPRFDSYGFKSSFYRGSKSTPGSRRFRKHIASVKNLAYQKPCPCPECTQDDDLLISLRPAIKGGSFTYPLILGRLEKRLNLQRASRKDKAFGGPNAEESKGKLPATCQSKTDIFYETQRKLIEMMDNIVVYKEIISSNCGNAYATVVLSSGFNLLP